MGVRTWIEGWPVYRQVTGSDPLGRGRAAQSPRSRGLQPRTATADRVAHSVCPYCAVGCAQKVYVKDEKVVQIEGNPDSPISRGRLCPKGSASKQLVTGPHRVDKVLYRAPYATDWSELDLSTAMEMVADRVLDARRKGWQDTDEKGNTVRRTMGIASLGGATLDNEENYLIKKLFTALGAVQIENQARVCHSSTVAALGTSFGRGGSTTFMQDLQHSDCILIEGSNFAECHPVGFQWVMEAKARGATVIHVDPRFTRTSAVSDLHVPIRAGSDVAFLGGLINHVLTEDKWFHDYVVNYTNAPVLINEDFKDTEELDGYFSGFQPDTRSYDTSTWQYEGMTVQAASGKREDQYDQRVSDEHAQSTAKGESHGSGGAALSGDGPKLDPTLQDPRCVFQILKRHYARYTPEMVEQVCGIDQPTFRRVCELVTENSNRDRTTALAYAVGWTQHTTGSQVIRAASVLQLLLGNIGRPGGGIMALRGHASIQGSSDIPTLYNLLPGYLPMPHAHAHEDFNAYIEGEAADTGFWGNMRSYAVSLFKAYWGDAAQADNDWCFDYLPRLTGSHGTYDTVNEQLDGRGKGYFLLGENPAVGSANGRAQRLGMANLEWLVVRDFDLIESATWWKVGPEIQTGELRTEDIETEVFFFPAAAHTEKDGTFTNTNRWLQWHWAAVEPKGDARSDLWFMYHLGRRIRERLADSTDEMDRPVLDLTWEYLTHSGHQEPSAEAVLAEINGWGPDRTPLSAYTELKDDGSTACGCWIYCGCYSGGTNMPARKKPWTEQDWIAEGWAGPSPAIRRDRSSGEGAGPDGRRCGRHGALVGWAAEQGRWTGHDGPGFTPALPPGCGPPDGARGAVAIG